MASEREEYLLEVIADMVGQFAYWNDSAGGYTTGGLSALECAFDALGWDDPHVEASVQCDEPGCTKQVHCGFPTPAGYRNTCRDHYVREEDE